MESSDTLCEKGDAGDDGEHGIQGLETHASPLTPSPGHTPQLNVPGPRRPSSEHCCREPCWLQQHLEQQQHGVVASIRSSLLSSAVETFGSRPFRLSATRPSSKGPLLPPSLLHLDVEQVKGCTQEQWCPARHQQALYGASPTSILGATRSWRASGSTGTAPCRQVSAPPAVLSMKSATAERVTASPQAPAAPPQEEAFLCANAKCGLSFVLKQSLAEHQPEHSSCSPGHRPGLTRQRAVWGSLSRSHFVGPLGPLRP